MNKVTRNHYLLFLSTQLFLPLCTLLGWLFQRPFRLTVPWLELILLAAASVYLTKLLRRETGSRWLLLLLPASILNGIFLLLQGALGGLAAFTVIGCGWALLQNTPKGFLRSLCYLLCAFACAVLILILPLWGFAQVVGTTRTIAKEPSPGHRYTATLQSIDQGALGGDTVVEVKDHKNSIHILLGEFVSSQTLWTGPWGAHEETTLSWQDETTLLINDIAYTVAGDHASLLANISSTLGTTLLDAQVLEYFDTHGGFLGDGTTFAQVRCRLTPPDTTFWHPLPGPDELEDLVNRCTDENGTNKIPKITNGSWFFLNRHPKNTQPDTIKNHGSWNFTLALFDEETGMLYYFEYDT